MASRDSAETETKRLVGKKKKRSRGSGCVWGCVNGEQRSERSGMGSLLSEVCSSGNLLLLWLLHWAETPLFIVLSHRVKQMYLIIPGITQESKMCMFLMKCGGCVRSLELREKNTRFLFLES